MNIRRFTESEQLVWGVCFDTAIIHFTGSYYVILFYYCLLNILFISLTYNIVYLYLILFIYYQLFYQSQVIISYCIG